MESGQAIQRLLSFRGALALLGQEVIEAHAAVTADLGEGDEGCRGWRWRVWEWEGLGRGTVIFSARVQRAGGRSLKAGI